MNTVVIKQFILSALLGLISSAFYLYSSYELDKVIGYNTANIIGLLIDHIINFFLQQWLFIGHLKDSKKFIVRFTIGNFITIIFSQLLFMITHEYVREYQKNFYKHKWNRYVSLIRYLLGAITYVFVSFPLRKYYIFNYN